MRQVQVSHIRALAVGQGSRRRLDVGTLDQPHVHAGLEQTIQIGRRTMEVRLHGRAKTARQAVTGDGQHAAHHGVGAIVVFGADLDVKPQMRQIDR